METGKSMVGLCDTMGDAIRKLDKVQAVLDQLNEDYFETLCQPSIPALITWVNKPAGTLSTDEERLTYDWIIGYPRAQSFVEIIEDYVRQSRAIMQEMAAGIAAMREGNQLYMQGKESGQNGNDKAML